MIQTNEATANNQLIELGPASDESRGSARSFNNLDSFADDRSPTLQNTPEFFLHRRSYSSASSFARNFNPGSDKINKSKTNPRLFILRDIEYMFDFPGFMEYCVENFKELHSKSDQILNAIRAIGFEQNKNQTFFDPALTRGLPVDTMEELDKLETRVSGGPDAIQWQALVSIPHSLIFVKDY